MSEYVGRREYMASTVGALTVFAGCVGTEDKNLENTSISELLENPEKYTDRTVKTRGNPEYQGDVTYIVSRFNPAIGITQPQPVTDPTYTLHPKDGEQTLPFRTSHKPDVLADLNEGEKLDEQVHVIGNFEEVEREDQRSYMIREANIEK